MKYGPELKTLQKIELEILKSIIRVCKDNEIEYFIIAGTALGAARHGGFIPWDDDIDIGMTRSNYDKFLSVAQNALGNDLFLQTSTTDLNSPFYFAKVRKNGTRFLEDYCKDIDMHHGIFVDVFPYDNIPDNCLLRREQQLSVRMLYNLYVSRALKGTSVLQKGFWGKLKVLVRKTVHYLIVPIPREYFFKLLDKKMKIYNNGKTEYKTNLLDRRSSRKAIDDETIYPLKEVDFNGILVSTLNRTDVLLTKTYGDYMTMPPKEKRVGHMPHELDLGCEENQV